MEQVIHCENCAYWQNGSYVLLKKETNDGGSCGKAISNY